MVVAHLEPLMGTDYVIGPRCHTPSVQGMGNTAHGVMVIGVAPGKDELRTGKPLTGPTGKMFDAILKAVGFPRQNLYVTNACCWYVDGKIQRHHIDRCFTRLEQEIALVRPRLIITLGTEVCQYFTNKTIKQARGAVLWSRRYGCYIMPMIQPAALFHDDSQTGNQESDRVSNTAYDIVRDLRKIPEVLEWPTDGSKSHYTYRVIQTRDEAQQVLNNLPRNIPVAVDVETNSKFVDIIDIMRDDLVCLAISDGTNTWVGVKDVFVGATWPMDVQYTFHHSPFDTGVIARRLGVMLPVAEDTMLMSYSCDERPGYHGLKPLSREYEGAGYYEENRAKGLAELMEYNAGDAAYTARLAQGKLRAWQEEEGTRAMYERLLVPAVNVYKHSQSRGARVDVQLLRQLETEWGDERDEQQDRLREIAYESGWPDRTINPNSWQQLSKLLYQIIGLPGGPSTAKDKLEALAGQHPFVDELLEYRHLQHNYGIYIEGWVNTIRQHGINHARVHPTVLLHGTATGRRSYKEPPVQTIPRPSNRVDKYGKLRQVIIPTSDDYEIAYADYSRAEIYTAYGYSHDPVMWEALQKDYHLETAVNAMKKSRERMMADADYREEMRRIAKTVTFGIMYGREAYSLSLEIECAVWEAQAYIDGWFNSNAVYAQWYKDTLAQLERTGEVVSITGRKRRFVLINANPRVLKQAVNFPIQSTAGDVTLQALIRLYEPLQRLDCHILFDVHDAIVFEINKKHRYEAMSTIKEIMESKPFPDIAPDFPSIPTEMYCGKSWGHAIKIKDLEELRGNAA